ncbi:MAG: hypothetical protein F6K00_11985 [Leptolyngbya sp. SIOISBB]|nr:hypothetical protein [Leptolyngbya sp. SIOISBB]
MTRRFPKFLRRIPLRSQKPPSSFDYQLFIVFCFGMMPQMLLPINGIARCVLTAIWVGILVHFAIQHRQKHQWQWQGITLSTLLKSIGILIFGLWCISPVIASAANMSLVGQDWTPSHPIDPFSEIVHLFPELMMTKDPITSFCMIPCIGLIFFVLAELKIAYLSEEEFLKDCIKKNIPTVRSRVIPDLIEDQQPKSFIQALVNLFKLRPFLLNKEIGSVNIDFYLISSQDLQASFFILIIALVFFIFACFGLAQI